MTSPWCPWSGRDLGPPSITRRVHCAGCGRMVMMVEGTLRKHRVPSPPTPTRDPSASGPLTPPELLNEAKVVTTAALRALEAAESAAAVKLLRRAQSFTERALSGEIHPQVGNVR